MHRHRRVGLFDENGFEFHMSADSIRRGFGRLGLLYAAIPVLAAPYDAYKAAVHDLEHQQAAKCLTICINEVMLAWDSGSS